MKRRSWFFWFAVVTASFVTLFAASFYVLLRSFQASAPSVKDGSVVVVDLGQAFPEEHLYDLSGPFFAASPLTFRDLLIAIARAKDDARVDRLFLRVRGSSLGWAHVSELRARLADFKSSGKSLVAYVEYAGSRDFAVASVADEIQMHPRGFLDLRGIRAELTFLRSTLDMVGVEAEFERIAEYKDAPDTFLRKEMSPESREAIGALVATLHDELITSIADGRGKTKAEAEELLARGPFTAEEALAEGLVDGLRYQDEVLRGDATESPPDMTVANYGLASQRGLSLGTAGRIAIIYGVGAIVSGRDGEDAVFGRVMGSDTIAEAFRTAREDESIDAVVFRIDSPGGSDVASDVIWREASLTREKKPVIVSMGDVAASGGYWIAMASDTIVAEPTTITGSIGIYAGKFNLRGLYAKLGVSKDGVSTAPNADFFSDSRSFTAEERATLRRILSSGYDAFLARVAKSRGMTTEDVDRIARGRVWSGASALEIGLVDELGGLYRALDIAKERAGLNAEDRVEIRILPEKKSLLEALLANVAGGVGSFTPSLVELDPEAILERSPLLALVASGRPLALMPYTIEIR